MANLDFFAAENDQCALLDFLFTSSDVRVFESYSDFDKELREFRSIDELANCIDLGVDRYGNGTAILLQLWSHSVMKELTVERFALNPKACEGHTFRHRIHGAGLIQLYFGGVNGQVITQSHFGHFSYAGARKWGREEEADWDALKKLSNQIQYHIRKRLGVGKVPGCPVLSQAYDLARAGYALKVAVQTPWQYELISKSPTKNR